MSEEEAVRQAQDKARLRAVVRGRVQGVGFRFFVLGEARRLHLAGGVWNHKDGPEAAVRAFNEIFSADR